MDERLQFVGRRLAGELMAELYREFGISRKTRYKILRRGPEYQAILHFREEALESSELLRISPTGALEPRADHSRARKQK